MSSSKAYKAIKDGSLGTSRAEWSLMRPLGNLGRHEQNTAGQGGCTIAMHGRAVFVIVGKLDGYGINPMGMRCGKTILGGVGRVLWSDP